MQHAIAGSDNVVKGRGGSIVCFIRMGSKRGGPKGGRNLLSGGVATHSKDHVRRWWWWLHFALTSPLLPYPYPLTSLFFLHCTRLAPHTMQQLQLERDEVTLRDIVDGNTLHLFQEHMQAVGVSRENQRRVVKSVRALQGGSGVRHPTTGATFCLPPGALRVFGGANIPYIIENAIAWLQQNGGDPSHGWLLLHPLRKFNAFKQHATHAALQ